MRFVSVKLNSLETLQRNRFQFKTFVCSVPSTLKRNAIRFFFGCSIDRTLAVHPENIRAVSGLVHEKLLLKVAVAKHGNFGNQATDIDLTSYSPVNHKVLMLFLRLYYSESLRYTLKKSSFYLL